MKEALKVTQHAGIYKKEGPFQNVVVTSGQDGLKETIKLIQFIRFTEIRAGRYKIKHFNCQHIGLNRPRLKPCSSANPHNQNSHFLEQVVNLDFCILSI